MNMRQQNVPIALLWKSEHGTNTKGEGGLFWGEQSKIQGKLGPEVLAGLQCPLMPPPCAGQRLLKLLRVSRMLTREEERPRKTRHGHKQAESRHEISALAMGTQLEDEEERRSHAR